MLYGLPGDPFYNLWVFAQLIGAKLKVAYPIGNPNPNHILLPTQPFLDFESQLLTRLFGVTSAYNLIIILSFVLTFLAGYLLANKLFKNKLAAVFSAAIITFLPYRIAQTKVHISLASTHWLIFSLYFLIALWKKPNFKNSLLLAIFSAVTLLDNFQYGFFLAAIAGVFLLYSLFWSLAAKKTKLWSRFLLWGAVAAAITFALAVLFDPIIIKGPQNMGPTRDTSELTVYSAHGFYYLLPSPELKFFSEFKAQRFQYLLDTLKTNTIEQTLYLGWIPLILALASLAGVKKIKEKFWYVFVWVLFLTGAFFSFAPTITLGPFKINTPAFYIFKVLPQIRVYSRFGFLSGVAIALLAGYFLAGLSAKIKNKSATYLFAFSLLILSLICFCPATVSFQNVNQIPNIYDNLKKLPVGPLVEYPLLPADEPLSYDYLVAQIKHHFSLVYGATPASEGDKLRRELLDPSSAQTITRLKELGVKYIIVHGDKYTPELIRKYPAELTDGKIPEIKNQNVELINCNEQKCLYKIK